MSHNFSFMFRFFIIVLITVVSCIPIGLMYGQLTVSGFVTEAESKESLVGVNIFCEALNIGTVTNEYGYFALNIDESLSIDSFPLTFSMIGYEPYISLVNMTNQKTNLVIDIALIPKAENLGEVVVLSDENINLNAPLGRLKLTATEIQNIPSIFGEKDLFKAIQFTPGIQRGTDGSSALFVRGGASDQNLVLLDGATVYNAFHLAGFFSTVNSDAVKNVEFFKGDFPSGYGGRLSSVVDILMREGSRDRFKVEGGIGLIASRLTVEGPLTKKKNASFIVTGKRSYFDLLYAPFAPDDRKDLYHLYDLNAKVNIDLSEKDRLFISSYTGGDSYSFTSASSRLDREMDLRWRNYTSVVRWTRVLNPKTFLSSAIVYSDYALRQDDFSSFLNDTGEERANETTNYTSSIRDLSAKGNISAITSIGDINFGIDLSRQIFRPESISISSSLFPEVAKNEASEIDTYQGVAFLENRGSLSAHINYTVGLRFNNYWTTDNVSYHYLEPRLSVTTRFSHRTSAKISYAHTSQFVSLLSNDGIGFPLDVWIPATNIIAPQLARQASIGVFNYIERFGLQVSLEGYYKRLSQINRLKEGALVLSGNTIDLQRLNVFGDETWEDKITQGEGESYGTELLIKKTKGRLSGWIGYMLSWTEHQFNDINQGRAFSPWFDRRHSLNLVGIYKINEKITLSGTWQITSGQLLTLYDNQFTGVTHSPWSSLENRIGQTAFAFDTKNNIRLSPFHRLDASISFYKEKSWGSRTWEISVINLYNQQNPAFFFPDTAVGDSNSLRRIYRQITLFPFLPSISYNFKFDK